MHMSARCHDRILNLSLVDAQHVGLPGSFAAILHPFQVQYSHHERRSESVCSFSSSHGCHGTVIRGDWAAEVFQELCFPHSQHGTLVDGFASARPLPRLSGTAYVSLHMRLGALLRCLAPSLLGLWGIGAAQYNVTLNVTASEIVYSPPACNASSKACESAWQIITLPGVTPTSDFVSTSGPTNGSGNIIPQLFLDFRGTALHIYTSSRSNATANITLSTEDPTISITTAVNTSAGLISVIGLPEGQTTTLTITYTATNESALLDILNITIITPYNDTSVFPTTTLPPSTSIPSFSPTVSVGPAQQAVKRSQTASDIVAEVLGALLGLVLGVLGAMGIGYYRRKHRRSTPSGTIQAT
ncbi:uncharacterized protein LAESUDRAFT_698998 [Laetiporus sulphureus 93-53]|uniref:Uncharacterized protein n=1 Tax=Laetiporus sulphureus 93-53 TaxID=1314785 RepID=A0A165EJY8_9APHY|nr:uncharacterized protein LAESUDRAFT_698998 [Laetiporus sulphureus 93-53]KZT07210.1 hypothetical protein LAESUDRAFT_698998 [Laetiporus sulphureus 93-53]